MRVLIVDDISAVREALRLLLSEQAGVDVVGEAADGEEALRLAALLRPDLVLIDLEMPRLDGLTAIRRLRGWPRPPNIVAMSLYGADERLRHQALEAGASACVEKGATLAELVTALLPPLTGQI